MDGEAARGHWRFPQVWAVLEVGLTDKQSPATRFRERQQGLMVRCVPDTIDGPHRQGNAIFVKPVITR